MHVTCKQAAPRWQAPNQYSTILISTLNVIVELNYGTTQYNRIYLQDRGTNNPESSLVK